MPRLSIDESTRIVARALEKAGASKAMAEAAAKALVAAEPRVVNEKSAACVIDAQGGLAYLAIVAIDPAALAGSEVYFERIETLINAMLSDEGVRLPGARRQKLIADAHANGIEIPDALLKQLRELAA